MIPVALNVVGFRSSASAVLTIDEVGAPLPFTFAAVNIFIAARFTEMAPRLGEEHQFEKVQNDQRHIDRETVPG